MSGHRLPYDWVEADFVIQDPGTGNALPREQIGAIAIAIGAGAETNTLADPINDFVFLTIACRSTSGGTRAITVASTYDNESNTVFTLTNAGDFITLESVPVGSGFKWKLIAATEGIRTKTRQVSIPLTNLRVITSSAFTLPGAAAGTPAGYVGLTPGTAGSATPIIVGESASNNSKSDVARLILTLPENYLSGSALTFRIRALRTGTLNVGGTVDLNCYKSDGGGGAGSDLVTTNAQTVTAAFANYDFTITPTGMVAGDVLDFTITLAADDTGGANGKLVQVGALALLYGSR